MRGNLHHLRPPEIISFDELYKGKQRSLIHICFEFKNRMNIRLDYGWGVYGNHNLPWDRNRSSAFL